MKYRLRIKITLVIAALLMITYMFVKISVLVGLRESTEITRWLEFFGVISYIPISILLIKDFINSTKDTASQDSMDKMIELESQLSCRMDAINKSNAVIEFDLKGNIIFANEMFLNTMGYSSNEEIIGKHHSLFIEESERGTKEYQDFWKSLREGKFFRGEVTRRRKNGALIYLQATYNPIIGPDEKPYRVMKIATDITESYNQQKELEKKNTYLEHAAKILRHDMHSGINTYMPRGLSSLDRRLSEEQIKELKIEAPIKMIKEGLRHTQKVYKGVYEFTNLVKKDVVLNREDLNLKDILEDYLSSTAYRPQVDLSDLGELSVNEALFCTCLLYTSPSPRDRQKSRMPSSA